MRVLGWPLVCALPIAPSLLSAGDSSFIEYAASEVVNGVRFAEKVAVEASDVVANVITVKRVPPNFSNKLKRACGEGSAAVRFVVTRDGKVSQLTLLSATCDGLGKETMQTVAKWQFKPATINGHSFAAYYQVTWNYKFSQ